MCWGLPNASGEGRLVVSVLTQPPMSTGQAVRALVAPGAFCVPRLSACHQAPCGMTMVPAITSSVTCAGRRSVPKRFDASTRSPVAMPRALASAGLIEMTCGTRRETAGTLPHDEWMRATLWKPNTRSGWSQARSVFDSLLRPFAGSPASDSHSRPPAGRNATDSHPWPSARSSASGSCAPSVVGRSTANSAGPHSGT